MQLRRPSMLLLLAFVIALSSWIAYGFLIPSQGPVIEEWETHNSRFKIRVQRRAHLYGLMSYWYVFQSSSKGSIRWQEVTRHLQGEPIALPKQQIRFVSEDVGYLFFQLKYAVTVDGGATWKVFDFGDNPSFKPKQLDYSRIAEVLIRPDGTGDITMLKYDSRAGQSTLFYTMDYGQKWILKPRTDGSN